MARRHARLSVGALALTGFAATAVGLSAPASAETANRRSHARRRRRGPARRPPSHGWPPPLRRDTRT